MEPFSERVTAAEWRADAHTWIDEELARRGIGRTGEIQQRRVRPWSTQLVAPTGDGTIWFKANCAAQAFEPALQALLARLSPDHVDEPLAVDHERGWMLTRDRGRTLRESHAPTLADWERVLADAARLQRLVADHERDVLAVRVPDCAPATVPARFDRMVELLRDRPVDDPANIRAEVIERLETARDDVDAAARLLAGAPLPATLQHGDLHTANVFALDGRIFDFGDAQWAHPLESLCIPWAITHNDSLIPWQRLVAAYHEPWADLLALDELGELLAAAFVTQPVNRSFGWWEALTESTQEEWNEWAEAPARHLANVLEPWP